MQRRDRRGRGRLERIGDGDEPREPPVHRDDHHRLAPRPAALRPPAGAPPSPRPAIIAALPSATSRPSTGPRTPLPVSASKSDTGASAIPRPSAPLHDRLGQRMLRAALEARGEPQQLGLVEARSPGAPRPAPAGLRSASRSCRRRACRPRQTAPAPRRRGPARRPARPRPVAVITDIGVARPSAQGQAMISTETADDQRMGERRRRPQRRPGDEGEHRDGDHRRHEPGGDRVGHPLDRRPAALRPRHHRDDPGQRRSRLRPARLDDEAAACRSACRR